MNASLLQPNPQPAHTLPAWQRGDHPALLHPLYAPLWREIRRWACLAHLRAEVATGLNALMADTGLRHQRLHHALRFVPPRTTKPPNNSLNAYEQRIMREGDIDTRSVAHDLFGGLVWLSFCASKSAINALHVQSLRANTVDAVPPLGRGPTRDFLTLFDEGGMIWVIDENSPLPWATWLQEHAWTTLFLEHRAQFKREVAPILFGHAIYEKALDPYPALTARCMILTCHASVVQALKTSPHESAFQQALLAVDQALAERLMAGAEAKTGTWQPRDLLPLPIFGIPDWADNADASFYADVKVFRPRATT